MDNWQRLEKVVRWTGLSVNAFALEIGLKRSENLYQIKKGNHGISKALAETITQKYPEVSRSWLLTGEGSMLKDGGDMWGQPQRGVPFYNVDISVIKDLGEAKVKPVYHIDIPVFNDCDFAALSTSSAMAPDIPAGAIVLLKEHEVEKVFPGEAYLIITRDFTGIRSVRLHMTDMEKFRLVPKNTADYDEMVVRKSDIEKIYLIKGYVVSKVL